MKYPVLPCFTQSIMILAQCPICHVSFTTFSDCVLSALPCGHVFHNFCASRWFAHSPTCPQCRRTVDPSRLAPRLYFDVVAVQPISSSINNLNSFKDVKAELVRVLEENARLTHALNECTGKCDQFGKKVTLLQQDVDSLTTYWLEYGYRLSASKKHREKLKIEVEELRKLLSDANAESTRLRTEIHGMRSIKKLIAASADDAQDILQRYSVKRKATVASCTATTAGDRIESVGEQSPSSAETLDNLESLSRWTAVLRSELTASREKVRSYRTEASRLRKMHAMALQRSTKTDESLTKCKLELNDANEMVRSLMGLIRHFRQEGGVDRGVVDPKEATTSERKAFGQGEYPADGSLSKRQLRSRAGKPFASRQYPSMQPLSTRDAGAKRSKSSIKSPIAQSSEITIANRSGLPPTRRSSRILQISNLRSHHRHSFQAVSTSTFSVSALSDTSQDRRITDSSRMVGTFADSKSTAVSTMKRNRRSKSAKPVRRSSRLRYLSGP